MAANSSIVCIDLVAGGVLKMNYPSSSSGGSGTSFISISGNDGALCGLSYQGLVTCFSGSTATVTQAPLQTFSSISFDGSSSGCGIVASTGLAQCWGTETETRCDNSLYPAPVPPLDVQWRYLGYGVGGACGVTLITNQVQCFGAPESLMVSGLLAFYFSFFCFFFSILISPIVLCANNNNP
jgi:hypothetical protein